MPPRELTSGWAEAIKHGLILDIDLLEAFERDNVPIQALERDLATDIIRRSVAIKAGIVSRDEKETLGVRVLLNYGHTIGHALEKVTAYGRLLHGEAVSVGMMGAAYISQAMGLLSEEEVARQASLLEKYGLPVSIDGVDVDAVAEALMSDKKVAGGTIRWVLLNGLGNAVTRNDVPTELVREALRMVAAPTPANG
jgi:3-dehydroquinate synthase